MSDVYRSQQTISQYICAKTRARLQNRGVGHDIMPNSANKHTMIR